MTGKLLTAREVGDALGVHAETVLRWTRRGELPGIRLPGGALRYREGALDAWLDARGAAPARGALPTPQDAAHAGSYRGTLGVVTHPEDEEAS